MTAVSEAEIRIEINGLRFIGKTQIWEFIDLIIRVYLLKLHTDCHLLPRSIRNQRESSFMHYSQSCGSGRIHLL